MTNRKIWKAFLILPIATLALAGCPTREGMENEMLKSRIHELEDENLSLKVQLAQLETKFKVRMNEGQNLKDIQAVSESLNWKSPVDVAVTAREQSVRTNMETIQVIAEVYAQEHQGHYPSLEVLLTRLPGELVNPFTDSGNLRDVVVAGLPGKPGVTGYDLSVDGAGQGVGYRIWGFGAEGLLKTVLKGGKG
jgi:hypothetical protein